MSVRYWVGGVVALVVAGVWLLLPAHPDAPAPGEQPGQSAGKSPGAVPVESAGEPAQRGDIPDAPAGHEPSAGMETPKGPPTGIEARRAQSRVARAFGTAFTAKGTQQAWLTGLERHVTKRMLEQLELTAPWRRPSGAVVTVEVADPDVLRPQFSLRYDSGLVLVGELAPHRSGWLVDAIAPAVSTPAGSDPAEGA